MSRVRGQRQRFATRSDILLWPFRWIEVVFTDPRDLAERGSLEMPITPEAATDQEEGDVDANGNRR